MICLCFYAVAQRLKRLPAMRETRVQSLGREDPLRRKWQPTPVFLPGESHGQRSLVGYSPRGRKESGMTERLHFHFHAVIQGALVTNTSVWDGHGVTGPPRAPPGGFSLSRQRHMPASPLRPQPPTPWPGGLTRQTSPSPRTPRKAAHECPSDPSDTGHPQRGLSRPWPSEAWLALRWLSVQQAGPHD